MPGSKANVLSHDQLSDRLIGDAGLFPFDIDLQSGTVTLVQMTAEEVAGASFLDARAIKDGAVEYVVPLQAVLDLGPRLFQNRKTVDYIFHVGHCGSTLVSRSMHEMPGVFSMREPVVLNRLARSIRAYRNNDHRSFQLTQVTLATVMCLLGRTFEPGDSVLLKPSSFCNVLIPWLMQWNAQSKAILLYVDLQTYLRTVTQDYHETENRGAMSSIHHFEANWHFGLDADAVSRLNHFQTSALIWLLNMAELAQTSAQPEAKGRVLLESFDDHLDDRSTSMERMASTLGRTIASDRIDQIVKSADITQMNAKIPTQAFSPQDRADRMRQAIELHGDSIDDAITWLGELASNHPPFETIVATFAQRPGRPA